MIELLRTLIAAVRALPGVPLRLAELEMRCADLERDADRVEAIVDELYLGRTSERAA